MAGKAWWWWSDALTQWRSLGVGLHSFALRLLRSVSPSPPSSSANSQSKITSNPITGMSFDVLKETDGRSTAIGYVSHSDQSLEARQKAARVGALFTAPFVGSATRPVQHASGVNTVRGPRLVVGYGSLSCRNLSSGAELPLLAERPVASRSSSGIFLDAGPCRTSLQPDPVWLSGPTAVSYSALQHSAAVLNTATNLLHGSSSTAGSTTRPFLLSLDEAITCHQTSWFACLTRSVLVSCILSAPRPFAR